jgi:hypothetical protein
LLLSAAIARSLYVAAEAAVEAVGICCSDLHHYKDGGIGSAIIHEQIVPGPARAVG